MLQELYKLLSEMNLERLVTQLIEHDRWRVLEKHRHEKELALLRAEKHPLDNSDFNKETSGGICTPSQEGLISKAKVSSGALQKANGDEFLALLYTISWCGQRLTRWPTAKDAQSAIKSLNSDLKKAVESYGEEEVLSKLEKFDQSLDFRIVAEQIAEIKESQNKRKSKSPLFIEFSKNFPFIDLNEFEAVYNKQGQKFVQAGVYILRREFKSNPPSELSVDPGHWSKSWPQYLPNYLSKWQEELKAIEKRMQIAQRAWKESIS
jgi:hypothetical protein